MSKIKNLPTTCPSCQQRLNVQSLTCDCCKTRIEGDYLLPVFMLLSDPEQQFIMDFVMCSGSLKEMAERMGLSYPTVRNRLDDILLHIKILNK